MMLSGLSNGTRERKNSNMVSSNGWEKVEAKIGSSIPCQRSLHAGAVWNDHFIVFGGYDGHHRVNDLYSFNFKTHQWQVLSNMNAPSPRDRHVATVFQNSLYIFGGFDGLARVNDLHTYDLEMNEWRQVFDYTGTPPTPRHSHAAVVYHESMFIFGGYDGSYRCDFHQFNFGHRIWIQVQSSGEVPRARYRGTCVVSGDSMILHGGHDGNRHLQDTHVFDFKSYTWSALITEGPIPSPRDSHIAVIFGKSMFLYGGSTGSAMGDFHELKLEFRRVWSPVTYGNKHKTNELYSNNNTPTRGNQIRQNLARNNTLPNNLNPNINNINNLNNNNNMNSMPFLSNRNNPNYYHPHTNHFDNLLNWQNNNNNNTDMNHYHMNGASNVNVGPNFSMVLPLPPPNLEQVENTNDEFQEFGVESILPVPDGFNHDLFQALQNQDMANEVTDEPPNPNTTLIIDNGILTPGARFCHVGVVYEDALYIFGGYDGTHRLNDFLKFEFETEEPQLSTTPSTIIADLKRYVNSDLLSDIQFIVEGIPIHAHKILCLRCPFFHNMLTGEYMESKASEVVIPDVKHGTFLQLLEYLYSDHVDIHIDTAMDLFQVADRFGIERLKKLCESEMLRAINVDTASHILLAADLHNAQNLREKCLSYILLHFDDVSRNAAFEEMGRTNVELVFEILRRR